MIEHAFDGADFGQDFQDIRHILGKQPSRKNNIEGYSRVLFSAPFFNPNRFLDEF
jgi:hypothetical protein